MRLYAVALDGAVTARGDEADGDFAELSGRLGLGVDLASRPES